MSQNTARYREVILEFISLYESEPCLWKIKSKGYHNREKRNAALDKLLEKYKEVDDKANRDIVLKKINSLRTAYNKEKKKVDDSKRSGASADAVYEPKPWYYKKLSFINDQHLARASTSTIDNEEDDADEEQEIEQEHINSENNLHPNKQCSQPNEQPSQPSEQSDNARSTAGNSASRPKPKRKNDDSLINSVLHSVNDHFKRPRDEVREDRHDIYCKSVASKLRDLPRQQRMLAEKLTNDVLFEAEWGNLTLDYKVVNTCPPNRRHSTSSSNYFSHSYETSTSSTNIQQINSPSYQVASPIHSSYRASPSPDMQHYQKTNPLLFQIASPIHSSYRATPSPNMQYKQQTNSLSHQITYPIHSSYQASPSPDMQQQTNSPSHQITSPSHSSPNVQNNEH